MHDSVHRSLFAGCAGSFLGTRRVVHPDIHALDQALCQTDVIPGYEYDLADETVLFGYLHDPLDKVLPGLVGRMGLSGEEELDRTLGIVDYGVEPVKVGEQEGTSLVGGETTGESDGEHIVPEILLDGHDLAGRIMVAGRRIGDYLLHDLDQAGLEDLPGRPYFLIRDLVHPVEAGFVVLVGLEFWTEYLGVDLLPLGCRPCRIMYSVGHIADEEFLGEVAGIHPVEDILAHLTVEPRHSVDVLRKAGGEETHAELLVLVRSIRFSKGHHGLPVDLQSLGIMADILPEKTFVE